MEGCVPKVQELQHKVCRLQPSLINKRPVIAKKETYASNGSRQGLAKTMNIDSGA